MPETSTDRDPIEAMADSFLARFRAGERPSVEEYAAKYPELADEIRELLPALVKLEQNFAPEKKEHGEAEQAAPPAPSRQVGEYLLLREIGRGGMGVVYEAVQQSLGRHVALKVLAGGELSGTSHLERFRREARAAARLHHTNIVPVFGVGEQGGVHYYAMQFIQGQGLDEIFDELRRLRSRPGSTAGVTGSADGPGNPDARLSYAVARGLLTGRFEPGRSGEAIEQASAETAATAVLEAPDQEGGKPGVGEVANSASPARAGTSSKHAVAVDESELSSSLSEAQYYRSVARVGLQVARALAYAHEQGVLHRDIKPSNLLLDAKGTVWVTDFGLAKADDSEALTGTGDIVGTLRYMAPERFEGRSDPRSDVYGLGVTLYEMLMLRPVFDETNRARLIDRVLHDEPLAPRKVDPDIPRDLETVILKSIAREPKERYQTASDLAEDLRCFLEFLPVSARRATAVDRAAKWARRHPSVVAWAATLLVLTVLGLAAGLFAVDREKVRAERERDHANVVAEDLRRQDYINRVNLAHREVLDDNVAHAEDLLDGCPDDLRNWEWHYVRRLCHLDRLTYCGHFEMVSCLAVSPDGTWVASGAGVPEHYSFDAERGEVRLWDVETGRERRVFPDLPGTVQTVAISPDGQLVAAGGGFYLPRPQGWLRVWDVSTGRVLWSRTVPGTTVMSLAFHPNGQSLAAGFGLHSGWAIFSGESNLDRADYAQLHRVTDGAPIGGLGKLVGGVYALAFDRDGRRLALAGFERIEVWDLESRLIGKPLTGHTNWVSCLAFSPDGRQLVSGGEDNTIKLWDLATGAEVRTIHGHRGYVKGLAFSPDGQQLASVSDDKSVRLWDPKTGRELTTFHGHSHGVYALAFHPDGRRILSGSMDGTIKVWDVVVSRPIVFRGHSGPIFSLEFRDDGHHVISRDGDMGSYALITTRSWNLDTGEEDRATPSQAQDHSLIPTDVAARGYSRSRLSPDGTLLAEGRQGLWLGGNDVEVRSTASGKVAFTLKGHTWRVVDIVFSADGSRIATGSDDRTVKFWDTTTGQAVLTLRGHTRAVTCVAFSPDGRRLVSGAKDCLVWDARPVSDSILTETRAHRLVHSRLPEWPRKSELIEQLRGDRALDQPTRAAAVRIAEQWPDRSQPRRLLLASWNIVKSSGRDSRDYQRALRWAEEGSRLGSAPNGTSLTFLGAAYYRVGRFQDVLDVLDRAESLPSFGLAREVPRIFRAMTLHRLDRRDEARSQLGQLLRQFQERPWEFSWSRTLLREAQALIDPEAAGTMSGAPPSHKVESP